MLKRLDDLLKSKRNAQIIFFVCLLMLCLLYNFQHELFTRPHGYHTWRQTDGFSVISNYYQVSMNFFKPRISQFISQDGLELAEFPISYYISALGYQVFGFHEWIPRLVHFLFVAFGLWCLFRLLSEVLGDYLYALIASLFLFTSPVLIFYSITPMPDVVGMSLSLAGLYYFYRYWQSLRVSYLIASCILYAIAGAVKPTSVLSFIVICGILPIYFLAGSGIRQSGKKVYISLACFAVVTGGLILGWWRYVFYYRALHHTSYFQTNSNPIWKATTKQINDVLLCVDIIWMKHYFNKPSILIVAILTLLIIPAALFSSRTRIVLLAYFAYAIGCACYLLFFFTQFYTHDYYIIVILPAFVASLALFLIVVRERYAHVFYASGFKTALLLFFLFNVGYASYRMHDRNTNPVFIREDHIPLTHIEPYLDSISVRRDDFVIYWGDGAPNTGLYLMNRRGWARWSLGEPLTTEKIEQHIAKGAKYLIVDRNQIEPDEVTNAAINRYSAHKISDRDNIQIYSLINH